MPSQIFAAARHPKSFVSLDTADHLLSRREDAAYAARVLAAWASRYVAASPAAAAGGRADGVLVEETGHGPLPAADHRRRAQLSRRRAAERGRRRAPARAPTISCSPALGACTSMTMRLYAERKGWPLERVSVRLRHAKIHASDCADCETRDDARIDEIQQARSSRRPARRRAARPAARDRRPLPRAPHAGIGGEDPHRVAGGVDRG